MRQLDSPPCLTISDDDYPADYEVEQSFEWPLDIQSSGMNWPEKIYPPTTPRDPELSFLGVAVADRFAAVADHSWTTSRNGFIAGVVLLPLPMD